MSSTKKDNIKEITNQLKESKDKYLEQQNQQITDAASNISDTTDKINESDGPRTVELVDLLSQFCPRFH